MVSMQQLKYNGKKAVYITLNVVFTYLPSACLKIRIFLIFPYLILAYKTCRLPNICYCFNTIKLKDHSNPPQIQWTVDTVSFHSKVLGFSLKDSATGRSSYRRCSLKKLFLKIPQISQKNTCVLESLFNKFAGQNTYFEEHLRATASAVTSETTNTKIYRALLQE